MTEAKVRSLADTHPPVYWGGSDEHRRSSTNAGDPQRVEHGNVKRN
jgi:hypothetical protein